LGYLELEHAEVEEGYETKQGIGLERTAAHQSPPSLNAEAVVAVLVELGLVAEVLVEREAVVAALVEVGLEVGSSEVGIVPGFEGN